MNTAKEKLNKIAAKEISSWKKEAKERKKTINWSKRSFKIAVRILREIRAQKPVNGMTQKKLASEMGVSPQYINKVVKGKENLTLETISKIEDVLGITLIEIPTFEASQILTLSTLKAKSALNRVASISISEDVWSYDNKLYSDATGTYG
ncbi:MAG: helix-turn-helix transcriptional regulator [Bacteroidales bacterium]|nr:helix-turn-helix transcriptional regulator [Bacteroidales bacterium]